MASRRAKPCLLRYGTNSEQFIQCFTGELPYRQANPKPNPKPNPFTLIGTTQLEPVCMIYDNLNNLYITTIYGIYIIPNGSPIPATPTLWFQGGIADIPVAMVFDQSYSTMYVTNFLASTISVIDMSTAQLTTTIRNIDLHYDNNVFPVGPLSNCNGVCTDSLYENLYVTNTVGNTNNIIRINLSTLVTTLITDIVEEPILICSNPKNNYLYVSSYTSNIIYQIVLQNGTYQTTEYITRGLSGPRGVVFSNNLFFITNYNETTNTSYISVYYVNPKTNIPQFLYNIINPVLNKPRGLCFNNNNNNTLFISNFGDNTIYSYKL